MWKVSVTRRLRTTSSSISSRGIRERRTTSLPMTTAPSAAAPIASVPAASVPIAVAPIARARTATGALSAGIGWLCSVLFLLRLQHLPKMPMEQQHGLAAGASQCRRAPPVQLQGGLDQRSAECVLIAGTCGAGKGFLVQLLPAVLQIEGHFPLGDARELRRQVRQEVFPRSE